MEAQESNYHSIEVADYFMKIFGYKRISPTDEELSELLPLIEVEFPLNSSPD